MAAFLSPEWIAVWRRAWAEGVAAPGLGASVSFALSAAPGSAEGYWWVLEDGLLAEAGVGIPPEADVTFTLTYTDAVSVAKGEAGLNAGFMQGRIKVAGDPAKLLSVLALTASPAYRRLVSELAAETQFAG